MGVGSFSSIRKEVLPLGSKQALSNGNEPEELTDLLRAFEVMNSCKLTLSSSLELTRGYIDMEWRLTARSLQTGLLDQPPLDLASVSVWAGDYKTLMGLLTRLLYSMDFQLALNEFDSAAPKKA